MATRLTPARSLQEELALRLRQDIQDNVLAPGDRLATEQAMMAAYGVSRTVIREAVAASPEARAFLWRAVEAWHESL